MARGRKKQVVEDLPVDKMDQFIKTHYKTILMGFAVVLLVAVGVYGGLSASANSKQKKMETIAAVEKDGFDSASKIEEYLKLAGSFSFASDYIHYRAATSFLALGDIQAAEKELALTGGKFDEYAKSLKYDVSEGGAVDSLLMADGAFAPVWYYRAVLSADEAQRGILMLQFRLAWPESQLLAQLDKWGYQ